MVKPLNIPLTSLITSFADLKNPFKTPPNIPNCFVQSVLKAPLSQVENDENLDLMVSHFCFTSSRRTVRAFPAFVFSVLKARTAPSFKAMVLLTTQSFNLVAASFTVSQFRHRSTPAAITAPIAIVTGPPSAETTELNAPNSPPPPVINPTKFVTVVTAPLIML